MARTERFTVTAAQIAAALDQEQGSPPQAFSDEVERLAWDKFDELVRTGALNALLKRKYKVRIGFETFLVVLPRATKIYVALGRVLPIFFGELEALCSLLPREVHINMKFQAGERGWGVEVSISTEARGGSLQIVTLVRRPNLEEEPTGLAMGLASALYIWPRRYIDAFHHEEVDVEDLGLLPQVMSDLQPRFSLPFNEGVAGHEVMEFMAAVKQELEEDAEVERTANDPSPDAHSMTFSPDEEEHMGRMRAVARHSF